MYCGVADEVEVGDWGVEVVGVGSPLVGKFVNPLYCLAGCRRRVLALASSSILACTCRRRYSISSWVMVML